MIKTLRIENFQSHADTYVELSPNVTVFTGESDKGKTAILRAFRKIVRNIPTGDFFIRYGQNECIITIVNDDNTTITRKVGKKNSVNLYQVNNDKYSNFGVTIPEEVKQALNIGDIQVFDKDKIDFNIGTQHEGLFLVGGAGIEALRGRIFGKITGSDVISRAISNLNSVIRSQNKEREDLLNKSNVIDSALANLAYLDDIKLIVDDVQRLHNDICALKNYIEKASVYFEDMRRIWQLNTKTQKSLDILQDIDVDYILDTIFLFNTLVSILETMNTVYLYIQLLKSVESLDVNSYSLNDLSDFVATYNNLHIISYDLDDISSKMCSLEDACSIDFDFDLSNEEDTYDTWLLLRKYRDDLDTIHNTQVSTETETENLTNTLSSYEQEIDDLKQSLKICPLCDRPF